jgi:hypothetical protein
MLRPEDIGEVHRAAVFISSESADGRDLHFRERTSTRMNQPDYAGGGPHGVGVFVTTDMIASHCR